MFSHHHHASRTYLHMHLQMFSFIHRHAMKGPIIELMAVNQEAAHKKLEKHVPNASEWRAISGAELKKVRANIKRANTRAANKAAKLTGQTLVTRKMSS